MARPPKTFQAQVNHGKEIAEISRDFARPLEVVREAIHNAYDAGATEITFRAFRETSRDGNDVLTLEFRDNGRGMDEAQLNNFFGLGFSDKHQLTDRQPIGFKGHGTKIFYQAQQLQVLTQRENGERLVAIVDNARTTIYAAENAPAITVLYNGEASTKASELKLKLNADHGTTIRLVDYTANSNTLIDAFKRSYVEDYLRWFTIFGSIQPALDPHFEPPVKLEIQGTDEREPKPVTFGHPWPNEDLIDPKRLREKDSRRPYSYFRKRFIKPEISISGSRHIAIAALFEGQRGRIDRDQNIHRRGNHRLYSEAERYGLWLCKDHIPIESRFDWLTDDTCPLLEDVFDLNLSQPLIFVNCQDFWLTANRGSVGNSPDVLLDAVKQGVYDYLRELRKDPEYEKFREEYREDLFSRLREKDRSALQRRIERYNIKQLLHITLPSGEPWKFYEPQREITLFGLVAQLAVLDPKLLDLEILDYDDHNGIDLLVRREHDPHDQLSRDKVAYTELKFILDPRINHPFENLSAIICWESNLKDNDQVTDPCDNHFKYNSIRGSDGVTHAQLIAPADSRLNHNIRVIELKRFLKERCNLSEERNPRPVTRGSTHPSGNKSKRTRARG
jgi:hypothetical protein